MKSKLRKNKRWIGTSLVFGFLFLFPNMVHASWMGDKVNDAISDVLGTIFEPIFEGMMYVLKAILVQPANMDGIPYVHNAMIGMQIIAFSLLATTLGFRGFMHMATGGSGGAPMSDILGKVWISAILIIALPHMLTDILLPLNSALISWIQALGVDFKNGIALLVFPIGQGLTTIIMAVIWLIALLVLVWSNAVRNAELIFIYMISPLLAVSNAGRGEALQAWIVQAVSVTFTQAAQYALVGLSFNLMLSSTYDWWTYVAGIGAIAVAVRGPQVIKQFLYSSGTAGGVGGAAQQLGGTAVYRMMLKGVK
ncbi:hypothetical protein A8L34_28235 [Bacillus sp. FJAT-27264]|uniref:conjugal transfer protein TrbL family protein n=1 Tax=Paenibacillus sp. (strain DSM 101736 / FJAT-27264) TaxID=1850362 RepID=UPI000807AC88|nr:conjugal transfer protein TrbL family protein [Bacillus sp. FJAT-27264]OBZ15938.1 hypothetical protein A8L34_28235 [Bacillus sp. FJAT-27264]